MNFFKDIRENTSTLQSKLKNISQEINTSWLPETKDILSNAANSLASATNQTTNPHSSASTPHPSTSSSSNISASSAGPPKPQPPPKQQPQPPPKQQQQQAPAASTTLKQKEPPKLTAEDESLYERKPPPQPQQPPLSPKPKQQPPAPTQQSQPQQQAPPPLTSSQRQKPSQQPSSKQPTLTKKTSFRSPSPETPPSEPAHPPPTISAGNPPGKPADIMHQQQQQQQQQQQIDPLQYNALFETNEALKSELQRLSVYELKCKSLEKEAKTSKSLKEANEKLEKEVQELSAYKEKCERLEKEINQLKLDRVSDDDSLRTFQLKTQENLERLENENASLKNKIRDLDKLVEEYEQNYNLLKQRELAIEKQNKHLENELDRLSEKSTSNEMHNQKLIAIEQANRILEQELESLKEQQKSERAKVKEKMELLSSKQNEKIKKLEDTNRTLELELSKIRDDSDSIINKLKLQFDDYKRRINELETYEKVNHNLEDQLKLMKDQIKSQNDLYLDEKKKFEVERKNFESLNENYTQMNEAMLNISRKYEHDMGDLEIKLKNLETLIDKKDNELEQMRNSRDTETNNFLSKLNLLNEENVNMASQLKHYSSSSASKDEEIGRLKKQLNELLTENEKLQAQLKSFHNLENELVEVHVKNSNAQEKINYYEVKLEESERRHAKELLEQQNVKQHLENELKQARQQLTNESLKNEILSADYASVKLELNKLDSFRTKSENLEKELVEVRTNRALKANEYELNNRRFHESGEKFESEIKLLHAQISNLQNDLRVKEQECRQLEKLLEAEKHKTTTLIKQLDELNSMNAQLSMQNSDSKRRLLSLELVTEECNQLRKNLTLMTIESESRKAEIATLNSQINILENTIRSLRDGSEKYTQLEMNYETTVHELKRKQDDYKKLQQFHDTVKKEQQDTIELLEDKLRDVEKKTELQSLKHEEILLELESLKARRERLMPMCPNCSTQTIGMYQPINQHASSSSYHQSMTQPHSQMCSPQPTVNVQSPALQVPSSTANLLNVTPSSMQQAASPQAQPLLSIAIPQQSLTPMISPSMLSQLPLQQFQAHLPHLQLIALPGKQSVTVDCQTSPQSGNNFDSLMYKFDTALRSVPKKNVSCETQPIVRANASSQTDILNEAKKPKLENREMNTDPIDLNPPPVRVKHTVNVGTGTTEPFSVTKLTRNQAVNVDLYAEKIATLPAPPPPPAPVVVKKTYEEKGIQSVLVADTPVPVPVPTTAPQPPAPVEEKHKYILYTCKYSYDPFKNSPNDNPEAELPLVAGEYLFILSEEDDDGFYLGETLGGKKGFVPSNFIERITLDANNLTKYLSTLPKNVLSHSKFTECLANYNLDASQLAVIAQQYVQKVNATPPQVATVTTSTTTISPQMTSTAINTDITGVAPPSQVAKPVTSKSANIDKLIQEVLEDGSTIKIGLPYPNNLKVEKRSETSLLVSWDPPTAPLPINQSIDAENLYAYDINEQVVNVQKYNLFLNHELHNVINGTDERIAILEDIDLSGPNRISIQAVTSKGGMSKPQECTLLFGSNRSFAPSNLSVHNLTQSSAIVSWWPSSSLFSHVISIDSIEHRTLKPGIFKFKLSGLLPDTSHLITITAQIPNHTNESSSNYAASVEFRTLSSRTLAIPMELCLERDLNEPEAFVLSWRPVVTMPNTISNGIPVGGYSIYLDGIRVHQILNPIASSVSLSSKLLFNGAKLLTLRTLSLDGNAESKDSEAIKLIKANFPPVNVVPEKKVPTQSAHPVQQPQQQPQQPLSPPQTQQPTVSKQPLSDLYQQQSVPSQQSQQQQQQPIQNLSQTNENSPFISAKKQPVTNEPKSIGGQPTYDEKPKTKPVPITQPQQPETFQQSPPQTAPKKSIIQMPKVSDAKKGSKAAESKLILANESDLYENNRSAPTSNQLQSGPKRKSSRQTSPNPLIGPGSTSKVSTGKTGKEDGSKSTTKHTNGVNKDTGGVKGERNFRPFIALFDYDPFKMSPNTDSCQEELPFKEGQFIKVYGEQDSDGFLYGECNGRAGYIPCNMVSELSLSDPDVMRQFMGESGSIESNTGSDKQKRKSQSTVSSSKSKTTKSQSNTRSQAKDQSFVPINNYSYKQPQSQTANKCLMIALYDYDPQSLSPNIDADAELPFKTGEIINVIGDMDEDGFYLGELNGRRGLVPSNFLQPIQQSQHEQDMYQNEPKQHSNRYGDSLKK